MIDLLAVLQAKLKEVFDKFDKDGGLAEHAIRHLCTASMSNLVATLPRSDPQSFSCPGKRKRGHLSRFSRPFTCSCTSIYLLKI